MTPNKEKPTSRTTAAEAEGVGRAPGVRPRLDQGPDEGEQPAGGQPGADQVQLAGPRVARLGHRPQRDGRSDHPDGTFTQKTADHETRSTRNPPASGPTARR
jgi:hypothetical protein